MEIKPLSSQELEVLYTSSLSRDFPPEERMPLKRMLALTRLGHQQTLGLFDGTSLAAYAVLILNQASRPAALLNYFAVEPGCRGQGVGGQALELLRRAAARLDLPYILFEVEAPESALNSQELETRQRRVRFYLRGGARPTGVDSWLYGVDYHIMLLPAQGQNPAPKSALVKAQLEALYLTALTETPEPGLSLGDVSRVFLPKGDVEGYYSP